MTIKTTSLVLMALIGTSLIQCGPNADKLIVPTLPGMDTFDFNMYSGYLPIGTTSKSLHFMFAESQKTVPKNSPVIVWFNGGPGCSSMLGWAAEHGPYVVEDGNTTFHYNEYSWNQEANMLYIESPGGVGYSTCAGTECSFNDDSSAADNRDAIIYFFEYFFPEYQTNDLWISGESYAGIYVPYVANLIDEYNTAHAGDQKFKPNMKGFIVGNGCTDWSYDTTPAFMEMSYWHGLIDDTLYDQIITNNCEPQFARFYAGNISPVCLKAYQRFAALTSSAGINPYDVYGICYLPATETENTQNDQFQLYSSQEIGVTKIGNEIKTYKKGMTAKDYTPWMFRDESDPSTHHLSVSPACVWEPTVDDYFNDPAVKTALHIPGSVTQAWSICTSGTFKYTQQATGSKWIYSKLKNKYRILKYSGDVDGSVPTYGTLGWITSLGWDITQTWRAYTVVDQTGGYIQEYDGLTFATVHGAGHMAPQWKRAETYYLIFNWISNKPI